jgi:hypothetical protein
VAFGPPGREDLSGTDFGDRMGRGSGQFAASALDTLSAACNRHTGKPALSRTRVGGLREWERALRPFGVSLSFAIQKISVMSVSYDAEAKRKGFDLRRLQFKLFGKLRLGSYPRRSHRVSAGAHCPSRLSAVLAVCGPRQRRGYLSGGHRPQA